MSHAGHALAPIRQEWNVRWIGILMGTALLAGLAGYAIGARGSDAALLTGEAHAGIGQISALASDGITYGIPLDDVAWLDAGGSMHVDGRAECLPADRNTGKVRFAALRWTAAGVAGYSVVLVDCRN